MKQLSLAKFLAMGWSPFMEGRLREKAADPLTHCLVAWDNAGKMSCSAFTGEPDEWPATSVAIWRKHPLQAAAADNVKSKTQQAVELVRRDGLNPNTAARQMGISASAVYRALRRTETKPICPCCGQVVRDGFEVKTP